MKVHVRQNSSGIALIMALIAITVLSLLAAAFALSMKVEARLAQNSDSERQMLWIGIAGVQRACWILAQENCPYHSLNQKWAGGPGDACETNGPLAGLSLDNYPVGGGTISLKIVDLERFANINIANAQIIQQALTLMGVSANDISVISDSILDWIQPGDLPRVAGAKSDYYQGLPIPYYAKEAPIDDLSELRMIRGVTEAIYSGHATGPAADVFQHKLGFGPPPAQSSEPQFGLTNVFTPFSNGRININTADTNVLAMIPGSDAAMAEIIRKTRAGPDGVDGTEDDTPFRNPGELGRLGLRLNTQQLTVRSSTFEVHVLAQYGDNHREYIAILFINSPRDIRVMSFYWKVG
jgi:type II secretory pathway component PulK